jgi:hypothetical protein
MLREEAASCAAGCRPVARQSQNSTGAREKFTLMKKKRPLCKPMTADCASLSAKALRREPC